MTAETAITFNSALEAGIRALCVLLPAYPNAFDLQRLTALDHLVVHTGDIGGPESLHPKLPMRSAEILVRRRLVERGLFLMMSRGLLERVVGERGIEYRAGDLAETFMMRLSDKARSQTRRMGCRPIRQSRRGSAPQHHEPCFRPMD